jgi:hypothetical protein
MTIVHAREPESGLDATFALLTDQAPAGTSFLTRLLATPRAIPALHAMWTGPEISCPVPFAMLNSELATPLPLENATMQPAPGEMVLSYVPPRVWGGTPDPIFDIGLFYGPGGRLLFPIGWLPGSVVARVEAGAVAALAEAARRIRQRGACTIRFVLETA